MPLERWSAWQPPGRVLDVSEWQKDDDFGIFPIGSRSKSTFRCPRPPPLPGLLAHHRYLYKQSSHRYPWQFLCEVLAARIGAAAELPVPRAWVAEDRRTGTTGALIEFFYGHPEVGGDALLVHGQDYLIREIPDFDTKRGHQHNLETVAKILTRLEDEERLVGWREFWSSAAAFDAVIGNTDRHQENWGILWPSDGSPGRMAPLFDNGTSLGHEILDGRLGAQRGADALDRYVRRGRHHLWWQSGDRRGGLHFELVDLVLSSWPATATGPRRLAELDDRALEEMVADLAEWPVASGWTNDCSLFVLDLLSARVDMLRERLD